VKVVTKPNSVFMANQLRPVLLKIARHLRREVHELGVTGGQATVLALIEANRGIGVGRLAELEGVSRPRMSKVVQELQIAGLVVGERGTDRRRVGLEVTPVAREVLGSVRKRRTAWLAARLQNLEPEELEALRDAIPLLEKLLEAPE
jgi:DNA-binding MarR family transcriptional regulator